MSRIRFAFRLSVLLVACLTNVARGQSEIVRTKVTVPNDLRFFTMNSWADDHGYILTQMDFTQKISHFTFSHRERGELSNYTGNLMVLDVLGFTSTAEEFTLYFWGYTAGKKDYYFLTFFKNGNRPPVMTNWLDKAISGDHLLSYSAFDKLYILKKGKENLTWVEVAAYNKVSTKNFPGTVDKEFVKSLGNDPLRLLVFGKTKADSKLGVLPYQDSVVVPVYKNKGLSISREGRLLDVGIFIFYKIDFTTGKISARKLVTPNEGESSLAIEGNHLYLLQFGINDIALGIYSYPSFALEREFRYSNEQSIAIQVGSLLDEEAKAEDTKWDEEKKGRKTINSLLRGSPHLSVATDSVSTEFFIRSEIVVHHYGTGAPGMSGGSYTTTYSLYLNACEQNGSPCQNYTPRVYGALYKRDAERKEEHKSDHSSQCENSNAVYSIHFDNSVREYFIEEYKK